MAIGDSTAGGRREEAPVRLGLSTGDAVSLLVIAPVVGMGIGVGLPWVAEWAENLPWVPFQGPLQLLASIDKTWGIAFGVVAGLVLGAALAVNTIRDTTRVTIAPDEVSLQRNGDTRRITCTDIAAVFLDGKQLVLTDDATRELAREEIDADAGRIEQAFRSYGNPCHDDDPHAGTFQRWIPGTPELSETVNTILVARERALREKDTEDADDLRTDLMKKGFVVKEQGSRQFWRPIP